MSKIFCELVSAEIAEVLCRKITADLPDYFGLPDANEHYAKGVQDRLNFAAKVDGEYVGLVSLEFPYPNNGNIYWMAVFKRWQGKSIGHSLIHEAVMYAKEKNANTMTVETLSPGEADENYLKTYHFYEKVGFKPLFNLKPQGYEWVMVYMCKEID